MPSPPRVAETMPTPLETYQQSMDEIKAYIKAHGFDAAAMFFGTGVYMGIYYAAPYFEIFGPVAGYILHNLTMGFTANLAVMPLVHYGRLYEGKTSAVALREALRYVIMCGVPDTLYQPVQDWFLSMIASESFASFEFVKDAVASFSSLEIGVSFCLFGVGFGLLYLVMKKLLMRHEPEVTVERLQQFDDFWLRFYERCEAVMDTTVFESVKAALQYFIFYLCDYFFDLSLDTAGKTLANLAGCGAFMAGYSFVGDSLIELVRYFKAQRIYYLSTQPVLAESLDTDYVDVRFVPEGGEGGYTLLEYAEMNLVEGATAESDIAYDWDAVEAEVSAAEAESVVMKSKRQPFVETIMPGSSKMLQAFSSTLLSPVSRTLSVNDASPPVASSALGF
jgi:hypothetical protein